MKIHYYFLPLCLAAGCFSACSSDDEMTMLQADATTENVQFETMASFPEKDKSSKLHTNSIRAVYTLLDKIGPEIDTGMPNFEITEAQYEEIKEFTDKLVEGLEKDADIYNKIFTWIVNNVKYNWADNNPYPVFKDKQGVCQGYANLLNTMLHTQGIPVVNINGMLEPLGGHAWNYVYYNNRWWVSDPTNNGRWSVEPLTGYEHLVPLSVDIDIFAESNFVCNYTDKHFNLKCVKESDDALVVPYSAGGIRITSFNPSVPLPSNVRELYIGSNIETFGESYVGLNDSRIAPNIEAVYLDEANTKLMSHCGVIYYKKGSKLCYIPQAMKVVELLPIAVMEKNYITNLHGMEELIIAPGTTELQAYAVENCPNLKRAYIPEDTKVDPQAFYSVHPDFEIVRGDLTGIPEIRM